MSLVEKALKKLQESAAAGSQPGARRPIESPSLASLNGSPRTVPIDSPRGTPAADRSSAAPAPPRPVSSKRIPVNRSVLRAEGLLPPEHQERQIADQYRQVKRPLIAAALNRGEGAIHNAHLIMVSSASPGDGKTFTSINLAISMSMEKDVSIVLVDADVPKPHISRLFGVEREPGLLDALRDTEIDIESLILPTDIPNLSILPAGKWSETATELLSSRRMEALMQQLGERDHHRICLIDSPPLLLTNESRVLAQHVGQVVVVVRAGKTLQQDLLDGLSHLQEGKSVGLVLNQSLSTSPGAYYGYGEAEREGSGQNK